MEIGEAVEFAGQIVSHNGVQPNTAYLQGIRDFPAPTTVAELRSFLGMINKLFTYHPRITRHTSVLQALLKKNTAFLWLEVYQAAFDKLKSELLSALALNLQPILEYTSHHRRVQIARTRVCPHATSGGQDSGDPMWIPIPLAKKNYSTHELELTTIVWAIQKCNFFLKGIEKFEVVTDHRPLIVIFAKPMPQINNARITRLREKILDCLFDVKWMAGKDNVTTVALSRAPAASTEGSTSVPISSCVIAPNAELANITECCQSDPAYREMVDAFNHG